MTTISSDGNTALLVSESIPGKLLSKLFLIAEQRSTQFDLTYV